MKNKLIVFILCSALLNVITSCSDGTDSLVGIYFVKINGKMQELIRVEKKGSKHFIEINQNNKWNSPIEVEPLDKNDFKKLFGEVENENFIGLKSKDAAILKVPKGWNKGNLSTETGYILLSGIGPMELHKK